MKDEYVRLAGPHAVKTTGAKGRINYEFFRSRYDAEQKLAELTLKNKNEIIDF